MAQHDLFNRVESSAYSWILDPTVAFVDWFTSDEGLPQEAYQSTVFARLRLCGEADAPSCLMDYLFIWLVEGGASQHCPTYEDWLLTIISITDQLRRGRFGERWTRPLPDGPNIGMETTATLAKSR
ncbi:hypothetical protein [Microbacterium sp. NPDC089188]|uniref:hypothetical protein n=1 Tax=Microbacterium sp. NPDC089188 TaxID=3154971 RepID=UPI00343399A2